jgi:glutathione S-transferase
MLEIFHLANSRSERIIWLAEELQIPYQVERFDRVEGLAPPEYRALHPLGRSPIIHDGDVELVESGAIIEYVLSRHGPGTLRPNPDSPEYPLYLQWLHMSEGTVMANLVSEYHVRSVGEEGAPNSPQLDALVDITQEDFAYMDRHLAAHPYFAGDAFTAADISMAAPIRFGTDWMKKDISPYPNIAAYLERIHARPAYKKTLTFG